MSPRYVIIVGNEGLPRDQVLERLRKATGLGTAYSNAAMVALANPACPCLPLGDDGCILGVLFRRHGLAERLTCLTCDEAIAIAESDGCVLRDRYWGGYVAAIGSSARIAIMRDGRLIQIGPPDAIAAAGFFGAGPARKRPYPQRPHLPDGQ